MIGHKDLLYLSFPNAKFPTIHGPDAIFNCVSAVFNIKVDPKSVFGLTEKRKALSRKLLSFSEQKDSPIFTLLPPEKRVNIYGYLDNKSTATFALTCKQSFCEINDSQKIDSGVSSFNKIYEKLKQKIDALLEPYEEYISKRNWNIPPNDLTEYISKRNLAIPPNGLIEALEKARRLSSSFKAHGIFLRCTDPKKLVDLSTTIRKLDALEKNCEKLLKEYAERTLD